MSSPRENSVKQLSDLYTVVIGLALSLAIFNLVDTSAAIIPLKHSYILNLLTFLCLIIPFYHGAVRHLFSTYVEDGGSKHVKSGGLLADFILLFFEGCIFVLMAASITNTTSLAVLIMGLLVLDSIWGFFAWLAITGAQSQFAEKQWAIINIITAIIMFVLVALFEDRLAEIPILSQGILFAMMMLRTIIDYYVAWDFYYPPGDFP